MARDPHDGHDHAPLGHAHAHAGEGGFGKAFALNLGFAIVELIGGVLTNSVAIAADAVHDLGDAAVLGTAWGMERYATGGPRGRYSYGMRRVSLLSAVVSALVLTVGSAVILFEAIPRLLSPEPVYAPGMVGLAVVGILVNGLAARTMHGGGTMNSQVARWHLLEDLFGWVAVFMGAVVMWLFDVPWIDPLLSIGLTLFILWGVFKRGRETLALFLQAAPEGVDLKALDAELGAIDGVQSTHHTHAWSLDGSRHVLSTHLVVSDATPADSFVCIKQAARDLAEHNGFAHVTVEVEFEREKCGMRHDSE